MSQVPVTVYAESTPNPLSMKFVASILLLPDGVAEYKKPEDAAGSPLAAGLFAFSDVRSVFITSNFVTVTKAPESDWFDLMPILREYVRGHLAAGQPVISIHPDAAHPDSSAQGSGALSTGAAADPGTEARIIEVLDEYVKPAVEQDGGAIHFRSFSGGVVTVELKGACSGCPSSTLTLKAGIENLLKQMVPGVTGVVAEPEAEPS